MTWGQGIIYRRSDFNCEYLLIANCEFFYVSQLIDLQHKRVRILQYGTGSSIVILADSQFGLICLECKLLRNAIYYYGLRYWLSLQLVNFSQLCGFDGRLPYIIV